MALKWWAELDLPNGSNFGVAIATATGESTKLSKKILPSSSVAAILICVFPAWLRSKSML